MVGKKLLLVDDEKNFLISIKQELDFVTDVFITDICFSVDEAIQHISSNIYEMIITDIRMPEKSGIDLLIYLRDIGFPGKVMVMTAYGTEENSEKIQSLGGVVDVISKPFKLEWFKDMLLDWFVEEKERAVTFESVDLKTVLQIINLEKKTSVLQIEKEDKKGMIYFVDGEIIHAEFETLKGNEALIKLVTLENSIISVLKGTQKVKPTIKIPFIQLIMELSSYKQETIDKTMPPISSKNESQLQVENEIKNLFKVLSEIKGYLGAGIVLPESMHFDMSSSTIEIPLKDIALKLNQPIEAAQTMFQEISFGEIEMMQIYSSKGIILIARPPEKEYDFQVFMVIHLEGNVAIALMKLKKVVEIVKSIW